MVKLNIALPEHFLDEETRCDYLVTSQMKEVWAVELDLCSKLLEVCRKYDIKVMAFGGTLLGAVRHNGFIPWDDDMDFMMMREDYEKLCSVAEKEFEYPYFFQTKYTDAGSYYPFAKLRNCSTTGILPHTMGKYGYHDFNQGIFIDILPYDGVISDEKKFNTQTNEMRILFKLVRLVHHISRMRHAKMRNKGLEFCRVILQPLFIAFGALDRRFGIERSLFSKFEKLSSKYNYLDTEMIEQISFKIYENEGFKLKYREDYLSTIDLPFECISMPVPANYDRVLRLMYGDYMKMVKGTDRHGEVIFDTSKPYLEYYKNATKMRK